MPTRFESSSRYLRRSPAEVDAEQRRLADCDISTMEPLSTAPDYISITWLASKLGIYGESHPSPTALKGASFIGQGATFSVYRAREYRDTTYAIKRPRLVFEYGKDEVHTLRQLYSLHLELRVLTDTRIRAHGNIAQLESIVWEEHPDDLARYWPSLVMEYAEYGTLSACYHRGLNFSLLEEKKLCFAIGDALSYLHENGIIHGDIKPDNVLMFRGDSPSSLVPKLSDFGFSVLDSNIATEPPLGGTPDWEAPEILEGRSCGEFLMLSDAYSYGLLTWYISKDGKNPFTFVEDVPVPFDNEEARESIRLLKKTKSIAAIASGSLVREKSFYSSIFGLTLTTDPKSRDLKAALVHLNQDESTAPLNGPVKTERILSRRAHASSFSVREFRHLGSRIQPQILESLAARARASGKINDVQRSEAAMAVAQICLESQCGKTQSEALDWLDLAASLGHDVAKSLLYRISTALGLYHERKDQVLEYLIESAEKGIIIAIEDLLVVNESIFETVYEKLKNKRREQCFPNMSLDSALPMSLEGLVLVDDDGQNILHKAAQCGELSLMQRVLLEVPERQQLLDARNTMGQTPLLLACIAKDISAARVLLSSGADAAISDDAGDNPLHWLHVFDNMEMSSIASLAETLLKNGADINAHTTRGDVDAFSRRLLFPGSPLHRAAAWNSGRVVKVLLEYGADPLQPVRSHELSTPLWLACTFHSDKAVEVILEHIAQEHIAQKGDVVGILNDDKRQEWPLLKPVLDLGYYYLNGATIGRIARHGSLYQAASKNTIRALQKHGARMILPSQIKHPDLRGLPAISQTILLRCFDIVQTMLNATPETAEMCDARFRQPPLHFAVQQDRVDLVKLLLSRNVDPHGRNWDGISALGQYANYHDGLEIPKLLLSEGLQFEIPSNHYQTPFFGAISRHAFNLAHFVLENTAPKDRHLMINAPCSTGPTFNTSPPGVTILGYLLSDCHQNTPRIVTRLFEVVHAFNETVNWVVSPGNTFTALHILSGFGTNDRIDAVISALANQIVDRCATSLNIDLVSNDNGRTALWGAVDVLNYDLVACLLNAGSDPNLPDRQGVSPLALLRSRLTPDGKRPTVVEEQKAMEPIIRLFASYGHKIQEES